MVNQRLQSRCFLVGLLLVNFLPTAIAVGPTNVRSVAQKSNTKPNAAELEQAAEKRATELVENHLPELRRVLEHLRRDNPVQYKRAIADLARSARKLEIASNRDEQLFELEVKTLKVQTQVDLTVARLRVRDSEEDRKKLRRLVMQLQRALIARSQYDVKALQARLQKAQEQLDNAKLRLESRESELEQLDSTVVSMLRKAGRDAEFGSEPSKKTPPRSKK